MAWRVTKHRPRYLKSELIRTYAGEQPDYFDVNTNKWYSCDVGSELVTNGTFSAETTGWTIGGTTTPTISNSTLLLTTGVIDGYAYQTINTDIGKKYKLKFSCSSSNGSTTVIVYNSTTKGVNAITPALTTYSNYTCEFTAVNTTFVFMFAVGTAVGSVYIDNVSIFPIDITPTTEITESRNYMNHIVHADNDGGVLYVEELPKIEYKDIIKADEFRGRNACTAWVNFNGTTTPPTIRDSYNVSAVSRIGTGQYHIYFKEAMDNDKYSTVATQGYQGSIDITNNDIDKVYFVTRNSTFSVQNDINVSVQIFGGRK